MADLTYSIGTVSVAADDTAVTGTGTLWESVNARQWDWISIDGGPLVPITDIADATHLTLALPSAEEKTDVAYVIYQVSPLRFAGGQAMADVSELIARLRAKGLMWYLPAGYTKPQDVQPPLTADDGQSILRVDTHELWVMQGGSWVSAGTYNGVIPRGEWGPGAYNANDIVSHGGAAYMALTNTEDEPPSADWMDLGAAGEAATVEVGTVTTGAPGSAASVTNSGDENAATLNFTIPRGSLVSVGSTTTSAPGSSADVSDSGTGGDVVLDFTIPTGKGYGGTSATELTIGTGSHTLDIEAGLAYVVGDRVHIGATSAPLNWMEGFVTAYTGASMTVAVGDVGGSGTFDAWGIGITGKPGAGDGDMKGANNGSDFDDPDEVLDNLGGTAVGKALFEASNSDAALAELGVGAKGIDIFKAANEAAALTELPSVYHLDNIIGTVGYSGGKNTGAIIEYGESATGYWRKLADGTMEVWGKVSYWTWNNRNISTAFGSVFIGSSGLSLTFPAEFYSAGSVDLVALTVNGNIISSIVYSITSSGFNIYPVSAVSLFNQTLPVHFYAKGRWRA